VATCDTDPQKLTDMMVGRAVKLNIDRPAPVDPQDRLKVEHLTVKDKEGVTVLSDATFTLRSGEILGVAGISGSGQKELLEAIAGLQNVEPGSRVVYIEPESGKEHDLCGLDPLKIRQLGVHLSFVPEDRLGMGLVGTMGMTGNMMLKTYGRGHGPLVDRRPSSKLATDIKEQLEVMTPGINYPVRRLSGGNVQKVLVGREIAADPTVLMTAYAVRGLDINTSYTIYRLMNEQKQRGAAVIYVGEDLDVLLELCDRIMVLCEGSVSGIVDGRTATKEQVGRLMTHLEKKEAQE
jgi:simple sugar transport system ATP-binding protein